MWNVEDIDATSLSWCRYGGKRKLAHGRLRSNATCCDTTVAPSPSPSAAPAPPLTAAIDRGWRPPGTSTRTCPDTRPSARNVVADVVLRTWLAVLPTWPPDARPNAARAASKPGTRNGAPNVIEVRRLVHRFCRAARFGPVPGPVPVGGTRPFGWLCRGRSGSCGGPNRPACTAGRINAIQKTLLKNRLCR